MKPNYVFIPLVTIIVALSGGLMTADGLESWYQTLTFPTWTPPGWVISIAWNIIFILSTISALWVWNRMPRTARFRWTIGVFIINGILNVLWTYLFFIRHQLFLAGWEAILLGASALLLMILIWPWRKSAALLLLPYVLWVSFATYLTFTIAGLNS